MNNSDFNKLYESVKEMDKVIRGEKMKKTRIISAFPACGKTYLFENGYEGKVILDSDSSKFSWNEDGTRNQDFPNNYIQHIKDSIGKADYIFVSSHIDVRKALVENDLNWVYVVPHTDCLNEWVGRCYLRGNTKEFIDTMIKNWDNWVGYSHIDNEAKMVYTLRNGEYISDKMYWIETAAYN